MLRRRKAVPKTKTALVAEARTRLLRDISLGVCLLYRNPVSIYWHIPVTAKSFYSLSISNPDELADGLDHYYGYPRGTFSNRAVNSLFDSIADYISGQCQEPFGVRLQNGDFPLAQD